MRPNPRIVVVGSANVDLTTFTDAFPRPGETIFGRRFDLGFGGKGANQAVAAALCGAETHLVARVGHDLFGPPTIANLKAFGVGTEHVRAVTGVHTGVAPIFVDAKGQNRIVVHKGANDVLTPGAVDEAAPLLGQADIIILQFEIPLETIEHTVRFAGERGITCILNPAPALQIDLTAVCGVDYFIPNESEAESFTGLPVGSVVEARTCATQLLACGFRRVILTLGERGALLAGPESMELLPPFPVESVDTTGAGDAFIGSFAASLGEGVPPREAVARASLYAALSTTGVGTQKSFPTRASLEAEWERRSSP